MLRIDVHAHFAPAEYRAAVVSVNPALANLPDCSMDALLAIMKRFKIDAAVVSLSPPHGEPGRARELAGVVNEFAADFRRAQPDRLATLDVLPLPDVESSLAVIARRLDKLDLDGFELFTNVAGIYVAIPRARKAWA